MPLIAILDDRITNRNIFAKLAGKIEADVSVATFADPEQALGWLDGHSPDLVITDYNMPGMTGAEFIEAFRARPDCADVPVIAITAYDERVFRHKTLDAGATDFLLSPIDHYEFVTRARNLLKMRRQQESVKDRASTLARELHDSERNRDAILRESRERLAQVIDNVPAMISAADRNGRCAFVNAYQASVYGIDGAAAVGRKATEVFRDDRTTRGERLDRMVFRSGKALPSYEESIVDATGGTRVFLTTKSPLRNGADQVVNVLTTSVDITERKRVENHLLHLAHHDTLTGLPNRTLLKDRLCCEIARARSAECFFALHLIDLDRFKGVNDTLGYQIGDELLKRMAERIAGLVRPIDTVARLGGNEFAILQADLNRPEDASSFAAELTRRLAEPFTWDGQELVITASTGIAIYPIHAGDADELLRNADLAMYQAKAEGRNAFCSFAPKMIKAVREGITLDADLRQALARQEFVLHYQPQIDMRSGRIVGAEALIRWQRPGKGLVGPGDFLPFAEEHGLIIPIGEWVLREACREAKSWSKAGLPPLRIGVNLSPLQFRRQDMRQLVTEVLRDTGLTPSSLELELTENIVLENTNAVVEDLRRLQELGVTISVDDFGTGYSSLAYLKSFPLNRLKIDQSFVRNLKSGTNDAAIVRAIINLGHSLDLEVVAEGAETLEQVSYLRSEGCDEVQGYFFSKPLPPDEFTAMVLRDAAPGGVGQLADAAPSLKKGVRR